MYEGGLVQWCNGLQGGEGGEDAVHADSAMQDMGWCLRHVR